MQASVQKKTYFYTLTYLLLYIVPVVPPWLVCLFLIKTASVLAIFFHIIWLKMSALFHFYLSKLKKKKLIIAN